MKMKLFATFFTAIALTLIPSVYANAQTIDEQPDTRPALERSIGRANIDNTMAGEEAPKPLSQSAETVGRPELIQNGRTVVTSDFGGSVIEYIQKYNRWRQEGRKLKVDDDCMSACTFLVGRIDPANVCVSPVTHFAFHSAYVMTFAGPMYAEEAT